MHLQQCRRIEIERSRHLAASSRVSSHKPLMLTRSALHPISCKPTTTGDAVNLRAWNSCTLQSSIPRVQKDRKLVLHCVTRSGIRGGGPPLATPATTVHQGTDFLVVYRGRHRQTWSWIMSKYIETHGRGRRRWASFLFSESGPIVLIKSCYTVCPMLFSCFIHQLIFHVSSSFEQGIARVGPSNRRVAPTV
ncbi:hypothetical protein LIA77_00553 [Sarocladium implicatum]|nr:hypothetical protein LIA77_00553 [Sarocladium implicatum]